MAAFVAKIISKKILGEKLENKFGREDAYFEQVPATRLDGSPNGKFKKRRKALPPGISEHDGQVLTKVKRRAYRLDMSLFNCCGIRFGWSSVIGIIPAIGDVLDAFMALMVVHTCQQIEGGLPQGVKMKMYFNVLVDFGIGIVPFLGDLADAVFRANTRNALLLEDYLREAGKKNLRQSGLPVPAVDPSDPHEFDRLQREDSPPHASQQPDRQPAMTTAPARTQNGNGNGANSGPAAPAAARVKESGAGGSGVPSRSGSLFGFGGGRPRQNDVEMGVVDGPDSRTGPKRLQSQRRS